MKTHVLQHAWFEGLGSIATWLAAQNAALSYSRFFENPALPEPHDLDLVIAMGGPMSVNDEAALPWLHDEKRFIREAISHGVPVLGVCLGAQLIASALGARIFPNRQKEIGWFPLEAVPSVGDAFRFPDKLTAFHWHGETYDLPPDAVHLARSAACENQAFQFGRRTIGLQFHLETSPAVVRAFAENCGNELHPAPFTQSEAELTAAPASRYTENNAVMTCVLDYLTAKQSACRFQAFPESTARSGSI